MTTAQLSMIAPPPSVAAVLGALTDEARIGQVDFSTRLAPEPEPEQNLDGYDEVVTLDNDETEADLAPEESDADDDGAEPVGAEPITLVSVPDLSDEGEPFADDADDAVDAELVETSTKQTRLEVPIHEPARLQQFEEPALRVDPDERPPTVEEIARLVIERMHDAELAMMRHLESIEVESARRSELLTAQAELDAELIRLNARHEAHSIVTAARVRAGEQVNIGAEERQLGELTESLSRFAEVVDELRPVGARAVSWGRTP